MRLVTRIGWVLLFALPHPAGAGPLVATSGSQAAEAQPLATSAPAIANVVPLSSPAQTTALANALKQLHSGQAENAAKELQKIRAGGGLADSAEAHYLIGSAWLAANKPNFAVLHLRQASRSYQALPDYALFNLGEAYLQLDRADAAVQAYERLLVDYPESVLTPRARLRLADALVAAQEWDRAKDLYQQVLDGGSTVEVPEVDLDMRIADCLESSGKTADAGALYFKVWRDYPATDYALTAGDKLDELAAEGVKIPSRDSIETRWSRALSMSIEGRTADALAEIDRISAGKGASKLPSDWRLRRALIHFRTKSYATARKELEEKVLPTVGRGPLHAESLYWLARTQSRLNDYDAALKTYDKLRKLYPKEKWSRDGLYKEGLIALDARDLGAAAAYFDLYGKTYPTAPDADEAMWYEGWSQYRAKKYGASEQTLRRLMETYPRSQLGPRAQYWTGRVQLLAGRKDQGISTLSALAREQALTYYGMLAAGILADNDIEVPPAEDENVTDLDEEPGDEAPDPATPSEKAPVIATDQPQTEPSTSPAAYRFHFARATALVRLGFQSDAAQELTAARAAAVTRLQKLELARMALAADYYHGAQYIARVSFSDELDKAGPSSEIFRLAYPKAFGKFVVSYAAQYKYSPSLIWAIMREESTFSPEVVSPVGAIGLLQIMPYTGQEIANSLGVKGFTADRLYDPEINIGFSAWYVRKLIERYGGNEALAIASYNAGPDAVDRWLTQRGDLDLDEFVEEIPYTETRRYVKRVLMSYGIYETLYGQGAPKVRASHTVEKAPLVGALSAATPANLAAPAPAVKAATPAGGAAGPGGSSSR